MSNLPSWPGASSVYSYLYKVDIIKALDKGDEETLKAIQMAYKLR